MSWLNERPRPVPSPAGFVVKKGLNIFSFTSGGMPVPLSRILISTLSPRFLVAAARLGQRQGRREIEARRRRRGKGRRQSDPGQESRHRQAALKYHLSNRGCCCQL